MKPTVIACPGSGSPREIMSETKRYGTRTGETYRP
jgi:hypothetical protein